MLNHDSGDAPAVTDETYLLLSLLQSDMLAAGKGGTWGTFPIGDRTPRFVELRGSALNMPKKIECQPRPSCADFTADLSSLSAKHQITIKEGDIKQTFVFKLKIAVAEPMAQIWIELFSNKCFLNF